MRQRVQQVNVPGVSPEQEGQVDMDVKFFMYGLGQTNGLFQTVVMGHLGKGSRTLNVVGHMGYHWL